MRTASGRILLPIVVLAGAGIAALVGVHSGTTAGTSAVKPDGVPGQHSLVESFTPAQLYAWRFPTNSPGGWTCTPSQVQVQKSDIALSTTGANGNCAVIQSTKLFPTTSGVIEARIYLPQDPGDPKQFADWDSMWMYGPNWPADGEIDAMESINGVNGVTYHYGATDRSAPTFNLQYSTRVPRTRSGKVGELEVAGPNVKPGWNTIDIAFAKNAIRVYYNGTLYTTVAGSYVTDKPAYLVFDAVSVAGEDRLGIPAEVQVSYVRVFS
jgi:beta-glucanase (GH16 family)